MAEVKIPIKTTYDGKGFKDLEKDAARAEREAIASTKRQEREAIAATRRQIANSRQVAQLTRKLDSDLAAEKAKRRENLQTGAGAVIGAGAILGAAGAQSIQAARESIKAENELQAALNSTGQAAAGYKDQLTALANELQKTTNFTDEEVIHAEAVLTTFTNLGQTVLPMATRAVTDMAALMGGDLQGAAIQVGKALNDPVNGLSALTRVGVTFTQQQKDQITAMVEAGDVAGAQAMILAELNKEFGGQAEAARKAEGGWKDIQVAAGDLQEEMGKLLLAIGDSGVGGAIVWLTEKLTAGAQAWQGAIGNVKLLTEAMDKLDPASSQEGWQGWLDTLGDLNPISQVAKFTTEYVFANEALSAAVQQTAAEHEAAAAAADNAAVAQLNAADSADTESAAQEELSKHLEDVKKIKEDTMGKIIEIDEKYQEDVKKTWDDYYKDTQAATIAHNKTLVKIETDKAKDLAKVDKELARDIAKVRKDNSVSIARSEQDASRQERNTKRQRSIQAAADERLFQFDLRQMAAEGDAAGIQAALERRAIEQQIDAEKRAEEDRVSQEERAVNTQRMQEDAVEQEREMRAQAQQRKEEIVLAAEEQRQAELESYALRMEDLRANREEKLAELEASKQEALAKLGEELAEAGELTKEELAQLAEDAGELGAGIGEALASGINEAFAENLAISQILNENGGGSGGSGGGDSGGSGGPITRPRNDRMQEFASGGSFMVGGSGGVDSELVQFMASPGERVTIAPPGGGGNSVTVNVNGVGGADLAGIIERKVNEGVDEYHRAVIAPWSRG